MPVCEHSTVCHRNAIDGHDGKCILHSEDPDKDQEEFTKALEEHWRTHGPDFRWIVFPDHADFKECVFGTEALFRGVTFTGIADFRDAVFEGEVQFLQTKFENICTFMEATFREEAMFSLTKFKDIADFANANFKDDFYFDSAAKDGDFSRATFEGDTIIRDSTFREGANFRGTTFKDKVDFSRTTFGGKVWFKEVNVQSESEFLAATFEGVADFQDATFKGRARIRSVTFKDEVLFARTFGPLDENEDVEVEFRKSEFQDRVVFAGGEDQIFEGWKVSFNDVDIQNASAHFRRADLSQCRFLRTDVRNIEFTGIKWRSGFQGDGLPWTSIRWEEWFRRVGLYDEIYEQDTPSIDVMLYDETQSKPQWPELERLYRKLKRNYEDRGDFPRAGDFHIGEKEARRRNPQTHWGAKFLLYAYRALSKYGERALPATFWLIGLVPSFALLYFLLGASTGPFCDPVSYPTALLSSLEATFYPLRPVGFENFGPRLLSIVQRLISPVIITLLVLALRQRIKR